MYKIEYRPLDTFPYRVTVDGEFVEMYSTLWGAKHGVKRIKRKVRKINEFNTSNS